MKERILAGKRPNIYRSESGMVAIMVTMILIIVISLIVLGFAQIVRRNQRQVLDHQLSSQAFYAAESGINDARKIIQTALDQGNPVYAKDTCEDATGPASSLYSGLQPKIDPDAGIEYTCLMVDPSPTELSYTSIGSKSTVVPIISANGTNMDTITLEWKADGISSPLADPTCPTAPLGNEFRPTTGWGCGYGVLRFDLVPTHDPNLTIDDLAKETMTSFGVPMNGGADGTINYPATQPASRNNSKNVFAANCDNTSCKLTIDVSSATSNNMHMRINSLYKDVSLKVQATNGGTPLRLNGAQALIDSTGKAQDVVRRIQVYVPLRDSSVNALSDYALQSSESVCKRYTVMDNYFDTDIPTAIGSPAVPITGISRLCQP